MTRWGLPFEFLQNCELSDFNDWTAARKALDLDDQLKAIRIAQYARPVAPDYVQQRQADLDAMRIDRDIALCDATPADVTYDPDADKRTAEKNIQIANVIGKVTRVKANGSGHKRNRRPPHA